MPISEALRLWTDLRRHHVPARFLYFPDENHWILKPQNARLWYETVLAFLDEQLRGQEFRRPELLLSSAAVRANVVARYRRPPDVLRGRWSAHWAP